MARNLKNIKLVKSPYKCLGIKTRICGEILSKVKNEDYDRWIEPFSGSCVVGLSERPTRAVFGDINPFVMEFFKGLQNGTFSPEVMTNFLKKENALLRQKGEKHFLEVRERFNKNKNILDYLFLCRTCFNGVARFNSKKNFSASFRKEVITEKMLYKIHSFMNEFLGIVTPEWEFLVQDFNDTFEMVKEDDILYCDPPYLGLANDYYSTWSIGEEERFFELCTSVPCEVIVSSWISRGSIKNERLGEWEKAGFTMQPVSRHSPVSAKVSTRETLVEAIFHRGKNIGGYWF